MRGLQEGWRRMLAIQRLGRRGPWDLMPVAVGLGGALVAGIAIARLDAPLMVVAALVVAAALIGAVVSGAARALTFVGSAVYVAILQWAYVAWVVPFYAYSGLITTAVGWPELLVVSALATLPAAWLATSLQRPSDVVLWFLYLFGYVPAIAIPIHLLGPDLGPVLPFSLLVAVAFGALGLARRVPPLRATWRGLPERWFERLLVVLALLAVAYMLLVFGLPTRIPGFDEVYDARSAYAAVVTGAPGSGYLVPWAGNVIFPFLIAVGLARRRGLLLVLGVGGAMLVYATTGFKTVLFSIAVVPAIFVLIRAARGSFGLLLAWGGAATIAASVAATIVSGSIWPLALFVTRLLAVPGQMTAYYLQFFGSNPTYALSESFLSSFNASPYDLEAPNLIGALFLEDPGINANANIWADAVANYGLLGIVPFTLALAAVLWILDSVAAKRSLLVIGPTLGLAGITLGNGAVFTSILTLGLGLTILLVGLLPEDHRASGEERLATRAP